MPGSGVFFGAGIVVGRNGDAVQVVTANHLVRQGEETATDLRVAFKHAPDRILRATALPALDAEADLAVIEVHDGRERLQPQLADHRTVGVGEGEQVVGPRAQEVGRLLGVGGDEPPDAAVRANAKWKEILEAYAPPPLDAGIAEGLADYVTREQPLMTYKAVSYMADRFLWFSIDKAKNELGYEPRGLRETVGASVEWFRSRI